MAKFERGDMWSDPRPDKRPQGGAYLLSVAMESISGGIDVHTSEW